MLCGLSPGEVRFVSTMHTIWFVYSMYDERLSLLYMLYDLSPVCTMHNLSPLRIIYMHKGYLLF